METPPFERWSVGSEGARSDRLHSPLRVNGDHIYDISKELTFFSDYRATESRLIFLNIFL